MANTDSFLKSYSMLTKFTSIICLSNFSVPKKRIANSELEMKPLNFILTVCKICSFLSIFIINNILMSQTTKAPTTSFIVSFVPKLLNFVGISICTINLIIEFKYRSHIWFMIASFCDFDTAVR